MLVKDAGAEVIGEMFYFAILFQLAKPQGTP